MVPTLTLLNVLAIICIFKYGIPVRFPWGWALAFALALLLGALQPLGSFYRFYMFMCLLSAVIAGSAILPRKADVVYRVGIALSIGVCLFVLADAIRAIPTPDVVIASGELQFNGLIRRPYALAHPNLVAAWSALLPLGVWTVVTAITTQSRGALFGLATVGIVRYAPRRWLPAALLGGALLLAGAVAIRPATAFDRLAFWEEGARLFLARPVTGWGTGSYYLSLVMDDPDAQAMAQAAGKRTGMHMAHNALLTIAAENGLLGVVPFLGMLIGIARIAIRAQHPARWGLLAFGVQQLFDDHWPHAVTAVLLGLVIAMLEE